MVGLIDAAAPLPAVARRAVRRVRPPPRARRDARRAARPRLGAARRCARCAATSTPRSRGCATSCSASRRRRDRRGAEGVAEPTTTGCWSRSAPSISRRSGSSSPAAPTARVLEVAIDPDEGPHAQPRARRAARAPGRRDRRAARARAADSVALLRGRTDAGRDRRGDRRRRVARVAAAHPGDRAAAHRGCASRCRWRSCG